MYHHWGCTTIYRQLSYPVRSLSVKAFKLILDVKCEFYHGKLTILIYPVKFLCTFTLKCRHTKMWFVDNMLIIATFKRCFIVDLQIIFYTSPSFDFHKFLLLSSYARQILCFNDVLNLQNLPQKHCEILLCLVLIITRMKTSIKTKL